MPKRGLDLSIQMIIVIIVLLIVLLAAAAFFSEGFEKLGGSLGGIGKDVAEQGQDSEAVVGDISGWAGYGEEGEGEGGA